MALDRAGLESLQPREVRVILSEAADAVVVRCMDGVLRDAFEARYQEMLAESKKEDGQRVGNIEYLAILLVRCLVDEDGARLYGDDETGDIKRLPTSTLMPLAEAAMRVNGLSEESAEELEKNSESGPSAASISGSHWLSDAPSENSLSESTVGN